MLQYKLQQADCMWGACAVLVELQAAWARLYASALWYEGYVVALQCWWALQCVGTADSSLSCPDLCQLTLTLPLESLRTSVAEAENQIQSCVGSACHSNVVTSLAFLGLFGNSVPHTVGVAARIENACRLNAATVCPSSSSQQFKVSFMIICMEVPHCSFFPIRMWVMSQRLSFHENKTYERPLGLWFIYISKMLHSVGIWKRHICRMLLYQATSFALAFKIYWSASFYCNVVVCFFTSV